MATTSTEDEESMTGRTTSPGQAHDVAGPSGQDAADTRPMALPEPREPRSRTARVPAVAVVVAAVASAAVLLVSALLAPAGDVAPGREGSIGERELVRITGPDGTTVETTALVDTGASSSSIDTALAEELGYDLDDADTVVVGSALGQEERPLVPGVLQLAGVATATDFNVNDRSERDDKVLLGRDDLGRYEILVGQRFLTTPGGERAPSVVDVVLANSPTLSPLALLALLPFAALVIVALRVVVGLGTLGTFSPVLLAIGYTQAGLLPGLVLTLVMFGLGFAAQPLLRRYRIPRVARLSVLIGLVCLLMLGVQIAFDATAAAGSWGAALPVVVTAVIVERLWETWDTDGPADATKEAVVTLLVAAAVTGVLLAPVMRQLAETVPLQLAFTCAVWSFVLGTYRGLRLLELSRFAPAARGREATV